MTSNNEKSLGQVIDTLTTALEGLDQSTMVIALNAVIDLLNIPFNKQTNKTSDTKTPIYAEQAKQKRVSQDKIIDIKSLKESKKPSNNIQMACVVAYYLDNLAPSVDRTDQITTKDLEKYFKQAGFNLPKKIKQVLIDAKAAGYFDPLGSGKYKLNPVGYNLVAHKLPK